MPIRHTRDLDRPARRHCRRPRVGAGRSSAGPAAAGVAVGEGPARTWTATENVAWKAEVPGRGWSSPIVWATRCSSPVVTDGKVPSRRTATSPRWHKTPDGEHRWMVFCLDPPPARSSGSGRPTRASRSTRSTSRTATPRKRPSPTASAVYAYFGNVGVFCYDLDGKKLWSKHVGRVPTRRLGHRPPRRCCTRTGSTSSTTTRRSRTWSPSTSKTGKEVWRRRDEKSNWATPFVWENEQRTEIVTRGTGKVRSYDLDGKLLWELGGMSRSACPTPVAAHGLLYVGSGYEFDRTQPMYAIRPGAPGDITLEEGRDEQRVHRLVANRPAPYNPAARATATTCTSCTTGASSPASRPRRASRSTSGSGWAGSFTASPWAYNGKVFCLNEDGDDLRRQGRAGVRGAGQEQARRSGSGDAGGR